MFGGCLQDGEVAQAMADQSYADQVMAEAVKIKKKYKALRLELSELVEAKRDEVQRFERALTEREFEYQVVLHSQNFAQHGSRADGRGVRLG
jgi:hypothetical protein